MDSPCLNVFMDTKTQKREFSGPTTCSDVIYFMRIFRSSLGCPRQLYASAGSNSVRPLAHMAVNIILPAPPCPTAGDLPPWCPPVSLAPPLATTIPAALPGTSTSRCHAAAQWSTASLCPSGAQHPSWPDTAKRGCLCARCGRDAKARGGGSFLAEVAAARAPPDGGRARRTTGRPRGGRARGRRGGCSSEGVVLGAVSGGCGWAGLLVIFFSKWIALQG
jgi:hypothetical protein